MRYARQRRNIRRCARGIASLAIAEITAKRQLCPTKIAGSARMLLFMKRRLFFLFYLFMVCALAGFMARAGLVLTNYTANHPLKVLPIGDSITDDSVTNGAWRIYLEPLLLSNGYNFTDLGRWTSTSRTGFAQVHHEGMDGSVIAAPGLSGPTHGYSAANNYSLLTVADALNSFSGTTPDLVLIDMGVNDMGRGRDPEDVATNNLSALLDLIFSYAPSANIIVSKPTTISYSTILSPPYDTYWQNMHIYGGAVQALAAARRAQGQNVYVADLFSVVYGTSMLNSDGTHPNAIGRQAIAKEMMLRIASITTQPYTATTPFIVGGSVWKYSDQGLNLGTNWSQSGFDDSTWSQGAGRLGYNLPGIATQVGFGTNFLNKNITTYFRHAFVVPANVSYTNLNVHLDRADGAVVYLNGQELYRMNMPTGAITYQTAANSDAPENGDDANTYFPSNVPIASLHAGTNVIAVEIHKYQPSDSALAFDLELFGQGLVKPTLSFNSVPGALRLAWPTNYSTFNLQTTTNLSSSNSWQTVPGPYTRSNSLFQVSVSTNSVSPQFFRLLKP
jgi:lysophospholipase L1-like esterase